MSNPTADPLLCVDTKVERHEDGVSITYYLADGKSVEQYLTVQEFADFYARMRVMLEAFCE